MGDGGGDDDARESGPHPSAIETEQTEYRVVVRQPKKPDRNDPNRPLTHGERVAAVIQGGLLIAAVVYASLQAWQLCEFRKGLALTRTSNAIAKQAMVADARAWVVPRLPKEPIEILCVDSVCGVPLSVSLRNVGKSPATHMALNNGWSWSADSLPRLSPTSSGGGFVPAGPENDAGVLVDPTFHFPLTARDDIMAHRSRLYVGGQIKYTDVLNSAGDTTWCAYYEPSTKDFVFCDDGNELR